MSVLHLGQGECAAAIQIIGLFMLGVAVDKKHVAALIETLAGRLLVLSGIIAASAGVACATTGMMTVGGIGSTQSLIVGTGVVAAFCQATSIILGPVIAASRAAREARGAEHDEP